MMHDGSSSNSIYVIVESTPFTAQLLFVDIESNFYHQQFYIPCFPISVVLNDQRIYWLASAKTCPGYDGVYTSFLDGSSVEQAYSRSNGVDLLISKLNNTAYFITSTTIYSCAITNTGAFIDCEIFVNNVRDNITKATLSDDRLFWLETTQLCSYVYAINVNSGGSGGTVANIVPIFKSTNSTCQFPTSYTYNDSNICEDIPKDNCNSYKKEKWNPTIAIIIIVISLTSVTICLIYIGCRKSLRRSIMRNTQASINIASTDSHVIYTENSPLLFPAPKPSEINRKL